MKINFCNHFCNHVDLQFFCKESTEASSGGGVSKRLQILEVGVQRSFVPREEFLGRPFWNSSYLDFGSQKYSKRQTIKPTKVWKIYHFFKATWVTR